MELIHDEIYDSSRLRPAWIEELAALWKFRDLIVQFVARSIKVRYKRSVLGIVWTILNPLMTMIVLSLVFSQLFRFATENYAIYVLSGLILWGFFSHATNTAMGEMVWSSSLLNRIYMPRSVFAVAAIGTGLVNLVISIFPLLLIALFLGVRFSWSLLALPFSILLLSLFTLGIGLLLATAVIYFADMMPVYEVLLTIWMYATPLIYPLSAVPERVHWVLRLNPMFYYIDIFRTPIMYAVIPGWTTWAIAAAWAFGTLLAGALVFTSRSHEFAYRV